MTSKNILAERRLKDIASDSVPEVDNYQIQLEWIKGLLEQEQYANRLEVYPSYYLRLMIIRRRLKT